jgi:hypothetical protein
VDEMRRAKLELMVLRDRLIKEDGDVALKADAALRGTECKSLPN